MHYSTSIKTLAKFLIISSVLLHPVFLIGAEKDKYKYHSNFSMLDYYLIRVYDIEKCGIPKNFYSKDYSWCLKQFPKVNKSNIELHFVINENTSLAKSFVKASITKKKELILKGITDFTNYYPYFIGIYAEDNKNNEQIIEEDDLVKLMDLYFHYCIDDKCYIKKKKIIL